MPKHKRQRCHLKNGREANGVHRVALTAFNPDIARLSYDEHNIDTDQVDLTGLEIDQINAAISTILFNWSMGPRIKLEQAEHLKILRERACFVGLGFR